jgi:hypothetical protein
VFEHYGIQLTLSAYVRRPGRMASRRLPAKITPAAMASRAGVIWQPDGRPNGTCCQSRSLVRAGLGDTIQTGGAETGASTCQSCPAWRRPGSGSGRRVMQALVDPVSMG